FFQKTLSKLDDKHQQLHNDLITLQEKLTEAKGHIDQEKNIISHLLETFSNANQLQIYHPCPDSLNHDPQGKNIKEEEEEKEEESKMGEECLFCYNDFDQDQ